ncbi:MAG: FAD-binding protein [Steroidobacteraceae bacterium]
MSKRRFVQALGALAATATAAAAGADKRGAHRRRDLLIIGAGTAGLPAAIFAAGRGANVLVVDVAAQIGGTLLLSSGQMSAAGTRLQRERGIADTPREHFDDLMRISRGTIDPVMARLAVDHAAPTFDWLMDQGYRVLPDYPVDGIAHEPYSKPRYYWSAGRGIAILDALRPGFTSGMAAGRIETLLEHRVIALQTERSGAVNGVVVEDSSGRHRDLQARNVLIASGGYASNPALFEKLSGMPKFLDRSYPWARGDGLALAESVGGYVRGAEKYLSNFGVILASHDLPTSQLARANFYPQRRRPWEIYVNADAQRFVREDVPSVDAREQALRFQRLMRHWVIFDQSVVEQAPPLIEDWGTQDMLDAFEGGLAYFYRADSIEALARAAGLPERPLVATIDAYNYGVHTGNDFFGRKHLPCKLAKPPFYAIRHQGTSITSTAGIAVNERLQVVRRDGTAVPNLYAAGEVLGSGATQGQAFCGGMMVTPAITFGRLLGRQLIRFT